MKMSSATRITELHSKWHWTENQRI